MSVDNPLLTALPPKTDYPTYLILLEYNLTPALLPTLHDVLQDPTLTTNIGWDLIHLLLPLLPASELCLNDVARLGNPREVVLKVTESLRQIDFGLEQEDATDAGSEDGPSEEPERHVIPDSMQRKLQADDAESRETQVTGGTSSTLAGSSNTATEPEGTTLPLPILQFTTLMSLLSVVHPRIKTKYPSRFLSMTLQAVLATYSEAVKTNHAEEMTAAVLRFIKIISGSKRPHLPPRQSSSQVPKASKVETAPDPEAHTEPPSSTEMSIQGRLLQSLLTHILEDYINSLSNIDDIAGLAWASRFEEKARPKKTLPGRSTHGERFANDESLQSRDTTVGQILVCKLLSLNKYSDTVTLRYSADILKALARDLDIKSEDLSSAFENLDTTTDTAASIGEESDPPTSVEDIPLSRAGALYLFTARIAAAQLFNASTPSCTFHIFPHHAAVLGAFIGTFASGGLRSVGTESSALIETVLALGLFALYSNEIGAPKDEDTFTQYLQTLSLLSANTPSPTLRYQAHTLTSQILHSHPSDLVRLSFIRDTLEHCPFESLKESAVSWLKTEILAANPASPLPFPHDTKEEKEPSTDDQVSIFATPVALDTLAPFLFPCPKRSLILPPLSEARQALSLNIGFYLAVLNFYYLLLSNSHIYQKLGIADLHRKHEVADSFLNPLAEAVRRLSGEDDEDKGSDSGDDESAMDMSRQREEGVVAEAAAAAATASFSDTSILGERLGLVNTLVRELLG